LNYWDVRHDDGSCRPVATTRVSGVRVGVHGETAPQHHSTRDSVVDLEIQVVPWWCRGGGIELVTNRYLGEPVAL
jgi:hypothetical protein